ncbi:MAG TPA: aldolase [Spirochaetota bacterium]|nr:aldolase [Spirochaetota bacterium]HPJ33714.1 aldolase [Spirochaetota bacterium]
MDLTAQVESSLFRLRKDLTELIETSGFCGLKGGTETEDMDYEELKLLHALGKDLVPVTVKIGGPEARTDIRYCYSTGIEGITAPMIESEYSLRNFINTLKNLIAPAHYPGLNKAINLETITGYRNIMEIADSPSFEDLASVTAARSDLSASMDMKPDDPEVMRVSTQIIKIARDRGKRTSVGGTITRSNFEDIAEIIRPDMINSRHVAVDLKRLSGSGMNNAAENMLSFEMDLFDLLGQLKPGREFYYKNRIEVNRERIGKKKVVYSMR